MKASYIVAVAGAAVVAFSGTGLAATEDYTGQATWLSSSVVTGCGADVNADGACFEVPAGASFVQVEVDDASGVQQAAFVTFQAAGQGPVTNAFDTAGPGQWICGSGAVPVPAGSDEVRVAVGDPVVGGSDCDSFASHGTITATFS